MCEHVWRELREQFLLGGHFSAGYRCEKCGRFVKEFALGETGTMSDVVELMGPHGGYISCSNESESCYRQFYNQRTGTLEKQAKK